MRLERAGLVTVIRQRTGSIACAVMYKRSGELNPPTVRDCIGKGYSFRQDLDDGHRPWALKPLSGYVNRRNQSPESHLARASLRPIFIRVLLDCMAPAM
jgi:hypothetical protein